jgi:hypothetical protein
MGGSGRPEGSGRPILLLLGVKRRVPLVLVGPELTALLAECPRGGGDVFAHAFGFVRHGVVWLGPDDPYPGCSAVEVVWQLRRDDGGWPRWRPSFAQDAYDHTRRRPVR